MAKKVRTKIVRNIESGIMKVFNAMRPKNKKLTVKKKKRRIKTR